MCLYGTFEIRVACNFMPAAFVEIPRDFNSSTLISKRVYLIIAHKRSFMIPVIVGQEIWDRYFRLVR